MSYYNIHQGEFQHFGDLLLPLMCIGYNYSNNIAQEHPISWAESLNYILNVVTFDKFACRKPKNSVTLPKDFSYKKRHLETWTLWCRSILTRRNCLFKSNKKCQSNGLKC